MYKKELTVKVTTKTDFEVTVSDPAQGKAVADQLGAAKTLHFKSENEYIIPFSSVKEAEVTSTTQEYDDPEDTLCVADPEPTPPTPGTCGLSDGDIYVPTDDMNVFSTTDADYYASEFQTGVQLTEFDSDGYAWVSGTLKYHPGVEGQFDGGNYLVLAGNDLLNAEYSVQEHVSVDGVDGAVLIPITQEELDGSVMIRKTCKAGGYTGAVIQFDNLALEVPSCELEASDIVPADGDTVVYADGGTQYTASQLQSDIVIDADTYQVSGTVYPAINGNYYIAVTKDPTITPMDEVLYGVDDYILVQTANGESLSFNKECASGAINIGLGTSGLTFES